MLRDGLWRLVPSALLGGLGGGLVFPILPALGLQMGLSGIVIGLILSANRITRLAFDAPAGWIVDRLGGRGPVSTGLLIEAFGILCYSVALQAASPTFWLMFGRAVFGIGSALLMVGIQATALGMSSQGNRGRIMTGVRISISLGLPLGLVLGGFLAEAFSDRTAFLVGAVVTFLAAVVAARIMPDAPTEGRAPVRRESLKARFRLFASPAVWPFMVTVWGFNLLIFFSVQGVMLATLILLVQQRHIEVLGLASQGSAGLVMAIMMGSASLAGLVLGRLIDRLHLRSSLPLPALIGLAIGFAMLALARESGILLAGVLLIGMTFNGVTLPMLALLGDVTPPDTYGRAVGIYQIFGDMGGSLGPVVGLDLALRFGIAPLYGGLSLAVLGSLVVAVWVKHRERVWRLNHAH